MRIRSLLFAISLMALANTANAQVLEFTTCDVQDPASLIAAVQTAYDALSDTARPTVVVHENLFNGADPSTHTIVVTYESFAAQGAFQASIRDKMATVLRLNASVAAVADCPTEGLFVQLGLWGNPDAAWEYYALYPIATTNAAKYAAEMDQLGNSDAAASMPAQMVLFENRAGVQGYTHAVVFTAPTLASLNEFIGEFLSSDDYGDFVDDVKAIRTLGTAAQAHRVLTLTP